MNVKNDKFKFKKMSLIIQHGVIFVHYADSKINDIKINMFLIVFYSGKCLKLEIEQ